MIKIKGIFKMVLGTAAVVLVTLLLFNQLSYTKTEPTNAVLVAMDQQFEAYRVIASESVKISMFISELTQKMTRDIFFASDQVRQEALFTKHSIITLSQKIQAKGISESKCINAIGVPEAIKRLNEDVEKASICFTGEANKGSSLETELTRAVNHFRGHAMEGRRTLEKCQKGEGVSNSCIATINRELRELGSLLLENLDILKEKTLLLEDRIDRRIASCRRVVSRSITLISNIKDKIKSC